MADDLNFLLNLNADEKCVIIIKFMVANKIKNFLLSAKLSFSVSREMLLLIFSHLIAFLDVLKEYLLVFFANSGATDI